MKLILSMCLLLITIVSTVSAQHVNIGIKAGLNVYNITSDDNSQYDTKLGYHLGLIGHIHYTKHFAIQPEITYSLQGAKFTSVGVDYKTNLAYINIPVLLQYMFNNGFRIEAGPQVGILVSAKNETDKVETDVSGNFKSLDFALGIGLSYVNVSTGFGVDARYNIGLSNINDIGTEKLMNSGLQVGVFYLFRHH